MNNGEEKYSVHIVESSSRGTQPQASSPPQSPKRKPLPSSSQVSGRTSAEGNGWPLPPAPMVAVDAGSDHLGGSRRSFEEGDDALMRGMPYHGSNGKPLAAPTVTDRPVIPLSSIASRPQHRLETPVHIQEPQSAVIVNRGHSPDSIPSHRRVSGRSSDGGHSRHTSRGSLGSIAENAQVPQSLHYHHQQFDQQPTSRVIGSRRVRPQFQSSLSESGPLPLAHEDQRPQSTHLTPGDPTRFGSGPRRPSSAYSSGSELSGRRTTSPQISPIHSGRGTSPDSRPMSFVDLLNVPYPQPPPAPANLDHSHLQQAVGSSASLLGTKKTLDMYRANVKKTNDPTIQYEFAVFTITAANEIVASAQLDGPADEESSIGSQAELLKEAKQILQRLSDRSYPFAQYYLGDGYASGLFSKGSEDYDRAFPLFIAASKHGHAEAGYRAALCYEFGWGTRKDFPKAVQYYRQSASKNHPGAMSRLGRACLSGDMGTGVKYREGIKWLKRAAESADFQYNSAPYDLGILHETGYGDDVFRDDAYAAQLFTQSADLGHPEANYRLGDAYEHGKLKCPKDPALSVHFYTGAATRGHPMAMMALCAWYMVGAEPVLEKDENEACEWARKAAELGKFFFCRPLPSIT